MKNLLTFAVGFLLLHGNSAFAQLYWNTNGASNTWTAANWGASTNGPFTTAWSGSSDVVFSAASILGFASAYVGDITVNANTTITANNTLASKSGGSVVTVADGVTLTWTSQNRSTTGTNNIWTKNGNGTWNIGAGTASDPSSGAKFTLNAGTVIATGGRAFGGPNATLTINGGTLQGNSGVNFLNKNIDLGGDFAFTGTGKWTFSGAVSLGSATRTITNTVTGNARELNGNISGTSTNAGLTFAGSGTTVLGGTNTYTGNTTVTAGTLNLHDNAQLRFSIGASGVNNQLINSGGTISLDGDFVFDLTIAGTTDNDSWTIATGTIGYNSTFSVASTLGTFTDMGSNIWERTENSKTYRFVESTSTLTVIPEPATLVLLTLTGVGFGGYAFRRRLRK